MNKLIIAVGLVTLVSAFATMADAKPSVVIVLPEIVITSAPCVVRPLLTGGVVRVCPGGVL